ncbi:hypothetical protein D3C87_1985580 [compost metagenome]
MPNAASSEAGRTLITKDPSSGRLAKRMRDAPISNRPRMRLVLGPNRPISLPEKPTMTIMIRMVIGRSARPLARADRPRICCR